jgi:peptide chain release factor 2
VWDDPSRGQKLTTKLSRLNADIHRYDRLVKKLDDLHVLDELLASENDPELSSELTTKLADFDRELEHVELAGLLSGQYDQSDAVASLHAGAGGIDSQDWADMLLRMYVRWAEREGLEAELDEVLPGEEAGIKSATFTVKGPNAYGLLSAERGVHRLVRLSPFDQAHRRHTSFASLDVIPLLPEEAEEDVEIDPKDLRIDTYRSSSAGGQHVNVTDSAVRITHRPTGITAACQNERSQIQNRAVAMRILKARLAERMRREREQKLENIRGERRDIEFGSQIRSYVLQPYRLVKDHRTNLEVGNVDAVLDGEIEEFIEAELHRRASEGAGQSAPSAR